MKSLMWLFTAAAVPQQIYLFHGEWCCSHSLGCVELSTLIGDLAAGEFKLLLAPARVLSIPSCANAKTLHALWPIRTPLPMIEQKNMRKR